MKRPRLDRALALTLLVLALLITVVLPVFAPAPDDTPDSIASSEPDGRLALALVLERVGFEPEAWRAAPGRLPRGPHVVWAARAPRPFGAHLGGPDDEGDGGDGDRETAEHAHVELARRLGPDALVLHDLAHYRRFVEDGGVLVLPAEERTQDFLREVELDALVPLAARGVARERGEGVLAFAGDDERIAVDWPAAGVLPLTDAAADAGVEPLAVLIAADGAAPDETGSATRGTPVAWSARVGAGRIVVLGDDGFARNGDVDLLGVGAAAGLGRREHGLLAVRLVERLTADRPGARLLFDETAIGRWRPETPLSLATSGARGLLLAHVVLLLAVLVWRMTWVREFPRDPEPLERVSPLVRARAQASLFARARRFDLLAAALRHGVLDGLARRLGRRPPHAPARDGEDGGGVAPADVERIAAALGVEDGARWKAAFLGAPPVDAAGLAALGRELAALERTSVPTAREHPGGVRVRRPASGIVAARAQAGDEPGGSPGGAREPRPRETAPDPERSER